MEAKQRVLAIVVLGVTAIGGCRVDTHKEGNNENVSVATPFGEDEDYKGLRDRLFDAVGYEDDSRAIREPECLQVAPDSFTCHRI